MDFINFNLSKTKSSRKKAIPVHYQKRCNANISNSKFNQSFIMGVYKRKIKSLLQNNASLVKEVQNYKCESSSREKMLIDTSTTSLEHIFSARLKLNNLSAVLKEAYLSVEEILSVLQLCSSVYPSKLDPDRKLTPKSNPETIQDSFESITELRESLEKPDDNFLTEVLGKNQDSSTCKGNKSGYNSNLPSGSSETETSIKMLHELNPAQKSAKPVAMTSKLTKVAKNKPKVSSVKTRKRRNSSVSKASNQLDLVTQVQSPNEGLQNSQHLFTPVSDPVQETEVLEAVAAKRNKLSLEPSAQKGKRCSIAQKSPLSCDKSREDAHWRGCLMAEDTVCTVTESGRGEYSEVDNAAICHINPLKTSDSSLKDLTFPISKPCNSKDILQKSTSKLIAKPKAKKLPKTNKSVQEQCSGSSSESSISSENEIPKDVIAADNTKSSANKHKTRRKVKFCFDSDEITNGRTKNQGKSCKSRPKMQNNFENEKSASDATSQRPVLQQVDNNSCINKQISENSFVVAAEIHPPPSPFINKTQSISTNYSNKNLQPCVVLTDIFEVNKSICPQDSSDDPVSCSEVQCKKKDTNSKVSEKHGNNSSMDSENSSPKQSTRAVARCRPGVSYKEPTLNRKMRRLN